MAGIETSESSPFLHLPIVLTRDESSSCVICVGSTGSGKSSTTCIYTGNQVPVSDSTLSVTRKCRLYLNLLEPSAAAWLDTVGWEDLEKDDNTTFKEILKYVQDHSRHKVLAVVWCVTPQVRTDASVIRQAEFINKLKEGEIWNNVIIVVKQSVNPKYDARGALAAATTFTQHANIQVVGYRFVTDLALTTPQRNMLNQNIEIRNVMNVLNDDEVRDILQNKINAIGDPVQIIFSDSVCVNCGEVGDVRLMGEFCHMELSLRHREEASLIHVEAVEKFHPTDRLCRIHSGSVRVGRCGRCCGCGACARPRFTCCGKKESSEGCHEVLMCCRKEATARGCKARYSCCGMPMEAPSKGCSNRFPCCNTDSSAPGCQSVCKKCLAPWGSEANGCFRTKHSVIGMHHQNSIRC